MYDFRITNITSMFRNLKNYLSADAMETKIIWKNLYGDEAVFDKITLKLFV